MVCHVVSIGTWSELFEFVVAKGHIAREVRLVAESVHCLHILRAGLLELAILELEHGGLVRGGR